MDRGQRDDERGQEKGPRLTASLYSKAKARKGEREHSIAYQRHNRTG
jgi:hypothetical protein